MRVLIEALCPGVEHSEEADLSSEAFGRLFWKWLRRQFVRQSEYYVRIGDRQNLLFAVGKPLIARPAVALRAVSVATRSVLNHLVRAMVALLYVRAKCGCAACTDISEDLALLRREHISPAFQELLTVLAKDIGDF